MVSDGSTLHPTDLHLHDILEEAASYKVIELTFKALILALALEDVIV